MAQIAFEKILGLSKREQKIYSGINNAPLTVAEIAREVSLPRMTVHYALIRLLERGVIERIKREGYFLYRRVSQEKLFMETLPQREMPAGSVTIPITKETGTIIHRGLKNIYTFYEKICRENANKRVRCIQTLVSTKCMIKAYSQKELDCLNEIIGKNKIICDVILEEDFFDPIFEKYGAKNFLKSLQVFLGRISITYMLPKNFISFRNDMLLFKNIAVFIDWEKEIVIELHNKEIYNMCSDLFETFKTHARRVEYRDVVQKYLPKK